MQGVRVSFHIISMVAYSEVKSRTIARSVHVDLKWRVTHSTVCIQGSDSEGCHPISSVKTEQGRGHAVATPHVEWKFTLTMLQYTETRDGESTRDHFFTS